MRKAPDAIRLGVIGMGLDNMASTLTLLSEVEDLNYRISAIASVPQETVSDCCRAFNIPFGSTDYREVVSRADVDVVCVFSPDPLHYEHVSAALKAGKHVVCTKPMVTTLADAKQLVSLVKQTGLKFLIGQTMRFDRQYLYVKELIENGALGDLIALEALYYHDMRPVFEATPWRVNVPQDFMFGGCVHCIDILRALGGDIESVHAFGNKQKQVVQVFRGF